MTGYSVRITRDDGSVASVDIDQMTDAELQRFIAYQRHAANAQDGWNWVGALAKWIRDNVNAEDT